MLIKYPTLDHSTRTQAYTQNLIDFLHFLKKVLAGQNQKLSRMRRTIMDRMAQVPLKGKSIPDFGTQTHNYPKLMYPVTPLGG